MYTNKQRMVFLWDYLTDLKRKLKNSTMMWLPAFNDL